jgi:hypothetical protein
MAAFRLLVLVALFVAEASAAFEADVHYGLTQWLALQAGYDSQSAKIIAIGDQRVDSGDMQFMDLDAMYACFGPDDIGAKRAGEHHYPTSGKVPGAAEQRAVSAGSEAATKAALAVTKVPPGQSRYRLFNLGEALHTLQDSWAHQGVPDTPHLPGDVLSCDATRAWGHPAPRGGWNSHKADLTMYWRADVLAMAKATYDILLRYPSTPESTREARRWSEIEPLLAAFISASSKTEKRDWFVAHGIEDVSFLDGINLPDGAQAFTLKWPDRKLPALQSATSRQHGIDPEVLDFYSRFFEAWVMTTDFDAIADEFGSTKRQTDLKRGNTPTSRAEFVARLKVWRLRDHGRVANLAHALRPLTTSERATIDKLVVARDALATYESPASAFFPLLPRIRGVSPLLPFDIAMVGPTDSSGPKAIAVAKFRHVPYDTVTVVAEKIDDRWTVTALGAIVDH